jgi:hypothetical protein
MKGSCKKRGSRRRGSKKGGFIFSRRHLRAPCDDTDYVKVAMPNVDETLYPNLIPKREEVKAEYKKCCPKSYLGFSNSHPYCKDMKGYIEKVNAEYKKSEDHCSRNVSSFKNEYGLQKHYEKCCPKGFFGRKNSSKYCKEIDAAISEKRQQAEDNAVEVAAIYDDGKQDVFTGENENILSTRGKGDYKGRGNDQALGVVLPLLVEYDQETVFDALDKGELDDMNEYQAIAYFEKMKKPKKKREEINIYPRTLQERMKTFFRRPPTNTRRQYETLPLKDFGFNANGKVNYSPEIPSNFKNPLERPSNFKNSLERPSNFNNPFSKGGRRTRRKTRTVKRRKGKKLANMKK